MKNIKILNINICNINTQQLLADIKEGIIIPLNVDVLMKLQEDETFYKFIQNSKQKICICLDSQVIRFFARILLGKKFIDKISGSDFLPLFCDFHRVDEEVKIYLLGAQEGVAMTAMNNINKRIGREIIVGAHSPSFGFDEKEDECLRIIEMINKSNATVSKLKLSIKIVLASSFPIISIISLYFSISFINLKLFFLFVILSKILFSILIFKSSKISIYSSKVKSSIRVSFVLSNNILASLTEKF